MAQLKGKVTRGRKKEPLRLAAAALAASLKPAKGDATDEVEVVVVPGEGRRKGESVTLSLPKGAAAIVPLDLCGDKTPENIRAQVRSGAKDAGVEVVLSSEAWVSDDEEHEGVIFVMTLK